MHSGALRGDPEGAQGEGREGAPTLPSALPNHVSLPLSTPSRAAQADLEAEVEAREDKDMELSVKMKCGLKQLKKVEAAEKEREAAEAAREAAEKEREAAEEEREALEKEREALEKEREAAEKEREVAEEEREAAEEERRVELADIQQRVEVEASLVRATFIAMLLSVLPCACI